MTPHACRLYLEQAFAENIKSNVVAHLCRPNGPRRESNDRSPMKKRKVTQRVLLRVCVYMYMYVPICVCFLPNLSSGICVYVLVCIY
jgi:hypothetical protein